MTSRIYFGAADMAKIDTNKDGSVSRDEFASAVKSGVIR